MGSMIGAVARRGVWAGLVALAAIAPAAAQTERVTLAVPNVSIVHSFAYVAEAMGFWKDQGLDVDLTVIDGPQATNAMIKGDVEFSESSGLSVLGSLAHGQKIISIGSVFKTVTMELVLSKADADKTGLSIATSTVDQRAKALKGLTLAADAPNSILDAFLNHILVRGGISRDKDMTVAYLQPPAVNAALESKQIDGFTMSAPWTSIAENKGTGVAWISAPRGDLPELQPFAFTTIATRPDYCPAHADICKKLLTGITRSFDYMQKEPEKSLALVAPQFKGTDPALVKAGFEQQLSILQPGARLSDAAYQVTQDFAVEAGTLTPAQKISKFDGVAYTNAYLP